MQDFANFLTQNPRYETALSEADNPQRFIEELHKAGYATDPDYSEKVLSVMREVKTMTQDAALIADNKIKGIRDI
jgi:flagellar protein FlgJ